jgi:hypothetical protein
MTPAEVVYELRWKQLPIMWNLQRILLFLRLDLLMLQHKENNSRHSLQAFITILFNCQQQSGEQDYLDCINIYVVT